MLGRTVVRSTTTRGGGAAISPELVGSRLLIATPSELPIGS